MRSLARSFDATAALFERLVGLQQAFVADASHQLRSPLAALRLRLENLEREPLDEQATADVGGALGEVARLSHLVDGLLALARAEQRPSRPTPIALDEVVQARCEAWSALAAERGVELRADVSGDRKPIATITPGALEQALDNPLNNAVEIAPRGSRVVVATDGRDTCVQVRDEGPGMTAAERARAFDRFWRSEGAEAGGVGLGLAIVRELVEADGGRVELVPNPDGGLIVRLCFPRPTGGDRF
ncbi:MAG TPA: HAMP domain-containing sensor histidine kinase [Acidimicrobiia bacterium]|nr:HAMP domain-containing sensor histidine kinase [Acidimicrobiia bacterium]